MKAVVCHSGGMDSSICLKLAIDKWGSDRVLSLGFDYGQRHSSEHEAAAFIAGAWGVRRQIVEIPLFDKIRNNALLDHTRPIEGVNTWVPGRNGLLVWHAALLAHGYGAEEVYLGVMEVETHYPDCSRDYIDAIEKILRRDLGVLSIVTPVIGINKKETLELADRLGILPFLWEHTVTCYEGIKGPGCGRCPSCSLRNGGYEAFLVDRTRGSKDQFA